MNLLSNEKFISRRSCTVSAKGMVASSQNLATLAGINILSSGGNAADAAITTAACLQVTQPCSTGLGGDCFILYFDAASGKIYALNGSGRSGQNLNTHRLIKEGFKERIPLLHPYAVTVPGAPAAWVDFHARFASLPLSKLLEPAVSLAEVGFPVAPYTSLWWQEGAEHQLSKQRHGHELMIGERGPRPGEIIRLPNLAASLKLLAEEGKSPFYTGRVAEKVIAAVNDAGGDLTLEDLATHQSTWVTPINIDFQGKKIWECPPNGQGLAALIALNIAKHLDLAKRESSLRLHQLAQCMRIGFADAAAYIADPEFCSIPLKELLSDTYAKSRSTEIDPEKVTIPSHGNLGNVYGAGTDTVYFCTSDNQGNACSFINSNFWGFGTGIVPEGCGYSLQNRGHGFVLDDNHPNALKPGKRPYHTIIPGMITEPDNRFFATFGVMGGMMQPQGHLQVLVSLLHDQLDPQATLDLPRFQINNGLANGTLLLEKPLESLSEDLLAKGHRLRIIDGTKRHLFGLGQIILRQSDNSTSSKPVYWGASDSRGDGCALGH